jgi:prephenate dehydratase
VRAHLIDPSVLAERIETVQAHPLAIDRARTWIHSIAP